MAKFNTWPANGAGSSASLNPEKNPLILYESNIPLLREAYEHNRSSFLHRLPPEIRNTVMEYSVTLEEYVEPLPVADNNPSINKFVWGDFEYRTGIMNGCEATFRFPTGPLAVVSLRRTCRQFYHELEGVFYRVNTFIFWDATQCENYLSALTIERRHQIHNICFDLTDATFDIWAEMRMADIKFLTSESRRISQVLLVNCPLLERLIIMMGTRPSRRRPVLDPQRAPEVTYHMDAFTSFEYERLNLLWKQGDRNPARIFERLNFYLAGLRGALDNPNMEDFGLVLPQLEFLITGSPTMFARVNGRMVQRSNSDIPRHMKQFEDNLEEANKKFQEFYDNVPEPTMEELFYRSESDRALLMGESIRMEKGPIPDLGNFKPFAPNRVKNQINNRLTTSQIPSRYDENGLLVFNSGIRPSIIEIMWRGKEILCGVSTVRPTFQKEYSFEHISRFASWDWIRKLLKIFDGPLSRPYQRITLILWSRMLIEHPSPKDIDAALRATGLLNYDEAPRDVLQAWVTLVRNQDRVMADLHKVLKEARTQAGREGSSLH
ncbi:hypothetical protein F4823DRAFT_641411 [Ustulina deusta]|nr:hypothetical protein F4823DRAFT_641411 [Ustulina deusta]